LTDEQTYKELCDQLIPQEDYFVGQYERLQEKFTGHFMTRKNKELKQQNERLEKEQSEMVRNNPHSPIELRNKNVGESDQCQGEGNPGPSQGN